MVEAPHLLKKQNDIVHAIAKAVDKCNQLVVGPNPTRRAEFYERNNAKIQKKSRRVFNRFVFIGNLFF